MLCHYTPWPTRGEGVRSRASGALVKTAWAEVTGDKDSAPASPATFAQAVERSPD